MHTHSRAPSLSLSLSLSESVGVAVAIQLCHRSHFGSRYKSGCCGHAGFFFRDAGSVPGGHAELHTHMQTYKAEGKEKRKADSTLRASRAVPHPSTDRALRRLTSEVGRDPVHSTRYGRQRRQCTSSFLWMPGDAAQCRAVLCCRGQQVTSVHFCSEWVFRWWRV